MIGAIYGQDASSTARMPHFGQNSTDSGQNGGPESAAAERGPFWPPILAAARSGIFLLSGFVGSKEGFSSSKQGFASSKQCFAGGSGSRLRLSRGTPGAHGVEASTIRGRQLLFVPGFDLFGAERNFLPPVLDLRLRARVYSESGAGSSRVLQVFGATEHAQRQPPHLAPHLSPLFITSSHDGRWATTPCKVLLGVH